MAELTTVRLGIVGGGSIAQQHLKGLAEMPDVRLAAFCDVVPARAEALAQQHGAAAFTEPERMVEEVDLDALYILLPPFAHGPAELAAIHRRLPFLVEKPVGNDLGRCRETAAMVAEAGLLTAVGYMNRYRRSVQRVKAALAADPGILAYGGWIGGTPQAREGSNWRWWVQRAMSGGQLGEQATHTVDLVRYLLGEAVEVFAHAAPPRTFNRGVPAEYDLDDATMVSIRFASGAIANVWACCAANAGGGVNLSVFAGHHSAYFTGWEHSLRLVSADADGQKTEETIPGESAIFPIEDRAFVDAVKTGDRSLVLANYEDGVRACEIAIAADESAATGKPVYLT